MQLETFIAPSMAEALKRVKTAFGEEAVIVQTRTVERRRWLGLRKSSHVEVTAGRGVAARRSPRMPSTPVQRAVPAVEAYARNAAAPQPPGKALLETPAASNVAMINLAEQMTSLRGTVDQLVKEVRNRSTPNVPEDLFDHYLKLIEADVAEEIATDVIRAVQRSLRPEQLQQPQVVRGRIVEHLEKLIPSSGAIQRKKAVGPHVVALIGPTGVGKTTTIAKLAAHLRLREKRKVGLITIDTYRIAAIDQLKRYADLIGVTLQVVGSPEEMAGAVAQMSDQEFVLIDTAGRSPNDTLKISELKRFLELAKPDEVHLVLSTTCGTRSAELATQRFGDVKYDRVIFTKIDEAAHLGVVLNVVRKINKSLSYITTGQDVPDDIEVGASRRLAKLIAGETVQD